MPMNQAMLKAYRTAIDEAETSDELEEVLDNVPQDYQDELEDEIAEARENFTSTLEDATAAEILQRVREDEFTRKTLIEAGVLDEEEAEEIEADSDEVEDESDADSEEEEAEPENGGEASEDSGADVENTGAEDEEDGAEDSEEGSEEDSDDPETEESDAEEESEESGAEDSLDEDGGLEDEDSLDDILDEASLDPEKEQRIKDEIRSTDDGLSDSDLATLRDAAEQLGADPESLDDADPGDLIAAVKHSAERSESSTRNSTSTPSRDGLEAIRAHWLGR